MINMTAKLKHWACAALAAATLCPLAIHAQSATTTNAPVKKGSYHREIVVIGHDVELRAEDTAGTVVVIGGSAKIHGKVEQDVVAVGGNIVIDGAVEGEVVTVMGDLTVAEGGRVERDLTCVLGESSVVDGGKVEGEVHNIMGGIARGGRFRMNGLGDWFQHCFMMARPLSLSVPWVWWIASLFLAMYFFIAMLFRYPVQCCVAQLNERPATTFAVGILAKVAMPVVCILLPITVIGFFLIPFLIVGCLLAAWVGKSALMEFIGGRFGSAFGVKIHPLLAYIIGAAFVTALYLIPVVGFLAFWVFGFWGFGAGVTALHVAWVARRKAAALNRPLPTPPTAPPSSPMPPTDSGSGPNPVMPSGPAPLAPALMLPQALLQPRAGFWERMGAGFLDMVLVALSSAVFGPFWFIFAIAYFAGMWAWRGTTVGGSVLSLQVVREDGGPLTFLTCLVRAVAAMFSSMIFFLGFFWIGWDRDKQGWHDKIAGTVVVRLPKAVSLVCY